MQTTPFEHVQCRGFSVVDEVGIERVRISTDQKGGRIDVVNNGETGCGFSLSFDTGQPSIAILDKDGKLGVTLTVNEEGGFLGIAGKDGKAKIILFVEDGGGEIVSGEDAYHA